MESVGADDEHVRHRVGLFDRVGELGLTPAEAAAVRRGIAEKLAPPALSPEQLETAVTATQLGAAPGRGPALASR